MNIKCKFITTNESMLKQKVDKMSLSVFTSCIWSVETQPNCWERFCFVAAEETALCWLTVEDTCDPGAAGSWHELFLRPTPNIITSTLLYQQCKQRLYSRWSSNGQSCLPQTQLKTVTVSEVWVLKRWNRQKYTFTHNVSQPASRIMMR